MGGHFVCITIDPSSTTSNWPDLHQHLIDCILVRLSHRDSLRFSAVCRSWHQAYCNPVYPPTQGPGLMLPTINPMIGSRKLYRLSDGKYLEVYVPSRKDCFASSPSGKWLLLVFSNSYPSLFNISTWKELPLPSLTPSRLPRYDIVVPSDPTTSESSIVAFRSSNMTVEFCQVGDNQWTHCVCKELSLGSLRNIVSCGGRLYIRTTMDHLMTVDPRCCPTTMELVSMKKCRLLSMGRKAIHRYSFLVESVGEVLLVRAVIWNRLWMSNCNAEPPSARDVSVKVFRADLSRKEWAEVGCLGDRVLFVGHGCSTSVSAMEIRGQMDHIYLTLAIDKGLHNGKSVYWCCLDYDMRSREARLCTPPMEIANFEVYYEGRSLWVLPSFGGRRETPATQRPDRRCCWFLYKRCFWLYFCLILLVVTVPPFIYLFVRFPGILTAVMFVFGFFLALYGQASDISNEVRYGL